MVTKSSKMVMLAVLLATLPICSVAGCKKKTQSADAKSAEIFDEEMPIQIEAFGSEQPRQSGRLYSSYSLSEDDEEYAEEPNDDEEFDDEEEQDEDYDDEEQSDDEEEEHSDDDPNGYHEDDSNDYSDGEASDGWL